MNDCEFCGTPYYDCEGHCECDGYLFSQAKKMILALLDCLNDEIKLLKTYGEEPAEKTVDISQNARDFTDLLC